MMDYVVVFLVAFAASLAGTAVGVYFGTQMMLPSLRALVKELSEPSRLPETRR